MKKFFTGAALALTCVLNAQWDSIATGYNLKYESIDFRDDNNGVLIGNDMSGNGSGYLLVTSDGGNTWGNPLGFQWARHDVDYTPMGSYWVVGDSGRVIYLGWPATGYIYQGNITHADLYCGFPVNDSVFYCAGENGFLFRTTNSGFTWDTLSSGTGENINDLYFTDAANGWIIADGGYVAATADSGATWQLVSTGTFGFYDFKGFAYQGPTASYPYLVGEAGIGLFSVNGGGQWWNFSTGAFTTLNKIAFMNTVSGVICGNNGYISRSTDGGGTWFNETVPGISANLFDIAFSNDTTAFICGDSGIVLRSRVDVSSVNETPSHPIAGNVYPNPTQDYFFVSLLLHEASDVTIELIDATGRTVQMNYYQNVSAGENRFEISTRELTPGFYFVRVMSGNSALTMPLLRQ